MSSPTPFESAVPAVPAAPSTGNPDPLDLDAMDAARSKLAAEFEAGKSKLSEITESARAAGRHRLDAGLGETANRIDTIGNAIDDAASRLKERQMDGVAAYTERLAGSIGDLAARLRNRSVDDLVSDARRVARDHPALFVAGSVAAGFALTRILKASSSSQRDDRFTEPGVTGNEDPGSEGWPATEQPHG